MVENLLAWTRAVLETTPGRWHTLTKTLPAELLTYPPAPGEWSALECLQHLVDTERTVFPVRVLCFLERRDFPGFDPDSQGSKSAASLPPAELATEFARMRQDSLELLAKLGAADLERRARHGELGPVTLDEMMHEWAAHDLMHTVQAEQAMMQPLINGSGPWQKY